MKPHDAALRECPECKEVREVGTHFLSTFEGFDSDGHPMYDEVNFASCEQCYQRAQDKGDLD